MQHDLKNEHFASFLRMTWNVAGHAKRWRCQNAREKFKRSPNLRVVLPQFLDAGFGMRAILQKLEFGIDAASI